MKFPQTPNLVTLILGIGLLTVLPGNAPAAPRVELGIDVLAANNFKGLEGKRIGLITNQTGVSASGRSTLDILHGTKGLNLVAIYAPEHGAYGTDYAGDYVPSVTDKQTGLPVYSLYGPSRKPSADMLKGIDVLVYDIQDIGCRSYTFISTLGLAMEAAGEAGIEFYVLDRPNPLNGNRVEGMPLDPSFRSFVSQWDIPYVYGLTAGELARMIAGERWISKRPRLTIVPMRGWEREMHWSDTGLMWISTSPNIPTAEAALSYPVTGPVGELGTVSIGIGYPLPFSVAGTPTISGFALTDSLVRREISGVFFRPIAFKPFGGAFKGLVVNGIQFHLRRPTSVNLTALGMSLIEDLQTALGKTVFSGASADQTSMFDRVCGSSAVRTQLAARKSAADLVTSWKPSIDAFRKKREPYLIYPIAPPPTPTPTPAPEPIIPTTPPSSKSTPSVIPAPEKDETPTAR